MPIHNGSFFCIPSLAKSKRKQRYCERPKNSSQVPNTINNEKLSKSIFIRLHSSCTYSHTFLSLTASRDYKRIVAMKTFYHIFYCIHFFFLWKLNYKTVTIIRMYIEECGQQKKNKKKQKKNFSKTNNMLIFK